MVSDGCNWRILAVLAKGGKDSHKARRSFRRLERVGNNSR